MHMTRKVFFSLMALGLLTQAFADVGDFTDPHTDGACDHEGQCVLLSIWAGAGTHMREYLDSFTLDDIARMAQGEIAWPVA